MGCQGVITILLAGSFTEFKREAALVPNSGGESQYGFLRQGRFHELLIRLGPYYYRVKVEAEQVPAFRAATVFHKAEHSR